MVGGVGGVSGGYFSGPAGNPYTDFVNLVKQFEKQFVANPGKPPFEGKSSSEIQSFFDGIIPPSSLSLKPPNIPNLKKLLEDFALHGGTLCQEVSLGQIQINDPKIKALQLLTHQIANDSALYSSGAMNSNAQGYLGMIDSMLNNPGLQNPDYYEENHANFEAFGSYVSES